MRAPQEREIKIEKEALDSLPLLYQALAHVWQKKGKIRIIDNVDFPGVLKDHR